MKYKINKQFSVEIPIKELAEVLRAAGILPADMNPEHNVHAGVAITARIVGPERASCLAISWQETEEIGEDGKEKKRKAADTAAKLRAGRKKKGGRR